MPGSADQEETIGPTIVRLGTRYEVLRNTLGLGVINQLDTAMIFVNNFDGPIVRDLIGQRTIRRSTRCK